MLAVHFNWLTIVVAAIVSFVVGGVWYSPPLFGKRWSELVGGMSAMKLVESFVVSLIAAFLLSIVISWTGASRYSEGLLVGGVGWLAFAGTGVLGNIAFEPKRMELDLINAGNQLLGFLAMGALIAHWK